MLVSGQAPRALQAPLAPVGRAGDKIRVDHLVKSFGEAPEIITALADFSLSVADSEFVSIVGPSGCGKTTALRIMAGLEAETSGSVSIRRSGPTSQPLNSMVFQEHSLFPWMTVGENAAFGLEMRGVPKRERLGRVEPFLIAMGLKRFRNHYPNQLSGGMKQRVSLARAFVNEPEILLMDEPFAALDAQNKLLMQELLLRIWEGQRKTVVFITHAIDEAIVLSDRIVVMTASPGRIKEIVPVNFPRPRSVAELHGDAGFAELHLKIWRILEAEVRAARQASEPEE